MKILSEVEFKRKNKLDHCTKCPIKIACASVDGVCSLVSPCQVCEIRDSCSSLCEQMKGFLNRGLKRQIDTLPLTDSIQSAIVKLEPKDSYKFSIKDIPWNCLSQRDKFIIQEHFLNGRSIKEISKSLNIHPDTVYKKIKGSRKRRGLLQKLKEFAYYKNNINMYGKYLSSKYEKILIEYFIDCNKLQEISNRYGQSIGKTHALLTKAKKLIKKFEE